MKKNKLQTKRKAQKGFRAMYARTVGRKVKASAAASADELDGDVPNVGIGKALTVILVLHVLAIVAIYLGTQWKNDDNNHDGKSGAIAMHEDNENETNATVNENPGTVYLDPPASYDLNNNDQSNTGAGDETNDSSNNSQGLSVEPRKRQPRVIKPRRDPNKAQPMSNPAVADYVNYKIKKGDNFYRLAKRHNIKQQELVDMNPNVKASRMKIGMIIKIPKK